MGKVVAPVGRRALGSGILNHGGSRAEARRCSLLMLWSVHCCRRGVCNRHRVARDAFATRIHCTSSSVAWPIITPYAIESIIYLMIANGLSRMSYKTITAGQLIGQEDPENGWHGGAWADQLLPH
jgi:hypothetical protein